MDRSSVQDRNSTVVNQSHFEVWRTHVGWILASAVAITVGIFMGFVSVGDILKYFSLSGEYIAGFGIAFFGTVFGGLYLHWRRERQEAIAFIRGTANTILYNYTALYAIIHKKYSWLTFLNVDFFNFTASLRFKYIRNPSVIDTIGIIQRMSASLNKAMSAAHEEAAYLSRLDTKIEVPDEQNSAYRLAQEARDIARTTASDSEECLILLREELKLLNMDVPPQRIEDITKAPIDQKAQYKELW
jgi:hypothetical protein